MPASNENPDCGASTIVVASIPTIWTTTFLTRDRADVAKVQFKSADLDAKRDALLKRFDDMLPVLAEREKREATAPKEGGDLAKALTPLVLRREHGRYQLLRFELRPPEPETPAKKPKPKNAQAAQK